MRSTVCGLFSWQLCPARELIDAPRLADISTVWLSCHCRRLSFSHLAGVGGGLLNYAAVI